MSVPIHLRRIASRLVVGIRGKTLQSVERSWLCTYKPSGVILFSRNVESRPQVQHLCRQLHEVLPPGAEICADHEGGPVSVLTAAAGHPPAPYTLGMIDDIDLTFGVFRDLALNTRSCGLDRLLAPCADILSEPLNPIIGARSFSSDSGCVSRQVDAAVRGLSAGGMASCLKHWPGHGGTILDSHQELEDHPVVDQTAPFLAGMAAGADAIMVGHLICDQSGNPATLNAGIIADLRRRMPIGSLLLSDDITMGALRRPLSRLIGRDYGLVQMIAPEDLDASWLERVAAPGLDRLLCRGIPWSVLPLTQDECPPGSREMDEEFDSAQCPDPQSWLQARSHAAKCFLGPTDAVLDWLDCASDHRWPSLDQQGIREAGWIGEIRNIVSQPIESGLSFSDLLLVTSHVPLTGAGIQALSGIRPDVGRCLVMGHPSLQNTLAEILPVHWRIKAAYDTDPADLAPFF